jgi:hypothetical protein
MSSKLNNDELAKRSNRFKENDSEEFLHDLYDELLDDFKANI